MQPGDTALRYTGFPDDTLHLLDGEFDYMYYTTNAASEPGSWQLADEQVRVSRIPAQNSLERSVVEAEGYGASLQSFFWNRKIVTTLGWRQDQVTVSDYLLPDLSANNPLTNPSYGTDRKAFTELAPNEENLPYSLRLKEPTMTSGVVFHITNNLRIFGQTSENFALTDSRIDNLYRPISPQNGETTEYGIGFSLFEDKLHAKLGFYETSQNLTSAGTSVARNRIPSFEAIVWNALEDAGRLDEWFAVTGWDAASGEPTLVQGRLIPGIDPDTDLPIMVGDETTKYEARTNVASTSNSVSKGYELTVTYNPTRNWRMHFNFGKLENVLTDQEAPVLDYVAYRAPFWGKFFAEGMRSNGFTDATVPPPGEPGADSALLSQRFLEIMGTELLENIETNGIGNPGISEYTAKITTNYSFREGRLNGLSVGTNLSWESGKTIGYELRPAVTSLGGLDNIDTFVADLDNQFIGDTHIRGGVMANYRRKIWNDKVDWRIQLNVKNLFKEGDLRVIRANPDGSFIYGISNPTTYQLSNSFRF